MPDVRSDVTELEVTDQGERRLGEMPGIPDRPFIRMTGPASGFEDASGGSDAR
jgi:hypothetical protein